MNALVVKNKTIEISDRKRKGIKSIRNTETRRQTTRARPNVSRTATSSVTKKGLLVLDVSQKGRKVLEREGERIDTLLQGPYYGDLAWGVGVRGHGRLWPPVF